MFSFRESKNYNVGYSGSRSDPSQESSVAKSFPFRPSPDRAFDTRGAAYSHGVASQEQLRCFSTATVLVAPSAQLKVTSRVVVFVALHDVQEVCSSARSFIEVSVLTRSNKREF